MIQCVQPEGALEYCSRICCTNTMKNALASEDAQPGLPGGRPLQEHHHLWLPREVLRGGARRGVLFVRYTDDDPPLVHHELRGARRVLSVHVREHVFGKTLTLEPDLLALSTAILPGRNSPSLAATLGRAALGRGLLPRGAPEDAPDGVRRRRHVPGRHGPLPQVHRGVHLASPWRPPAGP